MLIQRRSCKFVGKQKITYFMKQRHKPNADKGTYKHEERSSYKWIFFLSNSLYRFTISKRFWRILAKKETKQKIMNASSDDFSTRILYKQGTGITWNEGKNYNSPRKAGVFGEEWSLYLLPLQIFGRLWKLNVSYYRKYFFNWHFWGWIGGNNDFSINK